MKRHFIAALMASSILGLVPTLAFAAAQIYTNLNYKLSLNYSGLNMQTKVVSSYIPVDSNLNGDNLLTLYLKPSIYKGTNLEAALINIAVSKEYSSSTCYNLTSTDQNSGPYIHTRKVQGNAWHYALPNPKRSGAAGHSASIETYRLFKNNTCYETILQLSDFNRGNLDNPNSVKPYNEKKIFNFLGAVFNRLKVK